MKKIMLPTPDTSHVPLTLVYEPSEDSYLLLDTLASASERGFLRARFPAEAPPLAQTRLEPHTPISASTPTPLVVEIGAGSGVVSAFVAANAAYILGRGDVLLAGTDVNPHACRAARETVLKAICGERDGNAQKSGEDTKSTKGSKTTEPAKSTISTQEITTPKATFLSIHTADLASPFRPHQIDMLIFNPPYVPTEALPSKPKPKPQPKPGDIPSLGPDAQDNRPSFDEETYFLDLACAGGPQGMLVTSRLLDALPEVLSDRGCAYVLLCAQNRPEEVMGRMRGLGTGWRAEIVGSSGRKAGWEKLVVVRAWREEVLGV